MKIKPVNIVIIISIIVLILFLFPKNAGGGTCGFCAPGQYRWEEYNCLGFKQSYYPANCADCATTLLCYGIVFGEKTCYNSSSEPRTQVSCELVEVECIFDNDCATGGCSGEICGKKGEVEDIVTTCVFLPEYECLELTSCKCIENKCQWEDTREYEQCLEQVGS